MMARNRAVCTKMNNIEKKAKFAVVAAKDGERRRDRTRRFPLTERVVLRRSECARVTCDREASCAASRSSPACPALYLTLQPFSSVSGFTAVALRANR